MNRCYLCYAKQRFVNGEFRLQKQSMFLNDIDKKYIKSTFVTHTDTYKHHWSFSAPNRTAFSHSSEGSRTSIFSSMTSSPSAPRFDITTHHSPITNQTSPIPSSWKENDRVSHRVFGAGTVLRVYHDEVTENDKVEIKFDTQGVKTLLLTHAKLERI